MAKKAGRKSSIERELTHASTIPAATLMRAARLYYASADNPEPSARPEPPARAPKRESQIERLFPIYDALDQQGRDWRELKAGERWQKVGDLYKNKHGQELGRNAESQAFKRHKAKHP
jgi:hypothetical protein